MHIYIYNYVSIHTCRWYSVDSSTKSSTGQVYRHVTPGIQRCSLSGLACQGSRREASWLFVGYVFVCLSYKWPGVRMAPRTDHSTKTQTNKHTNQQASIHHPNQKQSPNRYRHPSYARVVEIPRRARRPGDGHPDQVIWL